MWVVSEVSVRQVSRVASLDRLTLSMGEQVGTA